MSLTNMDFDQKVEIIYSSEREDVIILNENYERILDELPDGEEKTKVIILCQHTHDRLLEL